MPRNRGMKVPTTVAEFQKLTYWDKRDLKVQLLDGHYTQFQDAMDGKCIDDLKTRLGNSYEKYKSWSRLDGRHDAITGVLMELPRCGDYWWIDLEQSLKKRGLHQLYYCLNPWERNDQYAGASGPPSPPPPSCFPQDPAEGAKAKEDGNQKAFADVIGNPEVIQAFTRAFQGFTNRQEHLADRAVQGQVGGHENGREVGTAQSITREDSSRCTVSSSGAMFGSSVPLGSGLDQSSASQSTADESLSQNLQPSSNGSKVCSEPSKEKSNSFSELDEQNKLSASEMPGNTLVPTETPPPEDAALPDNITPEENTDALVSLTDNTQQQDSETAACRSPLDDKVLNTDVQEDSSSVGKDQPLSSTAGGDEECKEQSKNPECMRQESDESLHEDGPSENVTAALDHDRRPERGDYAIPLFSHVSPSLPAQRPVPGWSPASFQQRQTSLVEGREEAETSGPAAGRSVEGPPLQVTYVTNITNNFHSDVKTVNVAEKNKITKKISVGNSTGLPGTTDVGDEAPNTGGEMESCEEEDPASFFAQETETGVVAPSQESAPSQQPGLYGVNHNGALDTPREERPESSYYPPWDRDAHETELKTVLAQQHDQEETGPSGTGTDDPERTEYHLSLADNGYQNDSSFLDLQSTKEKSAIELGNMQEPDTSHTADAVPSETVPSADVRSSQGQSEFHDNSDTTIILNTASEETEEARTQQQEQQNQNQLPSLTGWLRAPWTKLKEVLSLLE